MKKITSILTLLFLCLAVHAQTFVCTDINFYGSNLTPKEVQKEKAKYLGSKATLTFYDKSVRLSMNQNGKVESIILDKVNGNEYQYTEKKRTGDVGKLVVKLNKWVDYIKSFTLDFYKNYSLVGTVTYTRD